MNKKHVKQINNLKKYIPILLITAMIISAASGCSTSPTIKAADLMDGIAPGNASGRQADTIFAESMADFSIELFKRSIAENKNSLISPLSVTLALAMTANGADNETLAQMENLLAGGNITLAELNAYLYSYIENLPNMDKSKLSVANSIWLRDNDLLQVNPDFLQINADYYRAAAYKSPFDSQTVKDINNWVKLNTDGMIDSILNEINDNHVMYLINAIIFDAEWDNVYKKENISKGDFTNINGAVQNVEFMHSTEGRYLDDGMATGFVKPYADGGYSFVALLPNEDISIGSYIESLTGTKFLAALKDAQEVIVYASMPKFKYEYSIDMNDALITLGIPDAFDMDKADFTGMGTSPAGPLYIDKVLHKTYISVDELGTKAGAVTMVMQSAGSAGPPDEPKIVRLDRPFVYAIVDNATNLPLFLGTVMRVER